MIQLLLGSVLSLPAGSVLSACRMPKKMCAVELQAVFSVPILGH